jgi:ribonucleoside-diphosphate reductase alpha chain
MKISKIEVTDDIQHFFDIEVNGVHEYILSNGMVVHNSSKASGTTNGLYPVRELSLLKSDNSIIINWCAPEGEKLVNRYELAWDVPTKDMIDAYAIVQKFTDQAISADLYKRIIGDDTVTSKEMLSDYFYMTKMGLKTRYYQNSKTSDGVELGNDGEACGPGGGCVL